MITRNGEKTRSPSKIIKIVKREDKKRATSRASKSHKTPRRNIYNKLKMKATI